MRASIRRPLLASLLGPTLALTAPAEVLELVRAGTVNENNLRQTDMDAVANPFWTGWTQRKGETVDGKFVLDRRDKNLKDFPAAKSALGDCEFEITFSINPAEYGDRGGGRGPWIRLTDRGGFGFMDKGKRLVVNGDKNSLPLQAFSAPCRVDLSEGKLHRMSARRVGGVLSFHLDGQKITEQDIDPGANLIFYMGTLESHPRLVSMTLTADRLSEKLTTNFKSLAPIEVIFDGTGKPQETVTRQSDNKFDVPRIEGRNYAPGRAAVYRIPAMVVTKRGTLLAFAEARASGFDWGHIRLVVRRSTDQGKTWGPEIDTTNGRFPEHKIGNPVPIVDHQTGRIFLISHRNPSGHVHSGEQMIMIVHSDDDGKTWSEARLMPMAEWLPKGFGWMLSGPGHGIQLTQGESRGRLVAPCYGEGRGYVVYSDDHGKSWHVGAASPGMNINEAVCVELAEGDVMLNTRSPGSTRNRGTAILTKGGTALKDGSGRFISELPDANCQGSTARYSWPKDGSPGIILFAGPGVPTGRVQATLRASYDEGQTWPYTKQIYQGGSGYSDLAVLPDGKIAYLFEKDGKQDLGFTVIPGPPATPPTEAAE